VCVLSIGADGADAQEWTRTLSTNQQGAPNDESVAIRNRNLTD
jgi:hypothetical protein